MQLPSFPLHRFTAPVKVHPQPLYDVTVVHIGTRQLVRPSDNRGASFLHLEDQFAPNVHHAFTAVDSCKVTQPGAQLSKGFALRSTGRLHRRVELNNPSAPSILVGEQYLLVPQEEMRLETYAAEVDRLASQPCSISMRSTNSNSPASPAARWPPVTHEPQDPLSAYVSYALLHLCTRDVDLLTRVMAGLYYLDASATDLTTSTLLAGPLHRMEVALLAMQTYEPPQDVITGDSDCYRIREALVEGINRLSGRSAR